LALAVKEPLLLGLQPGVISYINNLPVAVLLKLDVVPLLINIMLVIEPAWKITWFSLPRT
jgi:hypothetical protein